jgi:hypothetical protein
MICTRVSSFTHEALSRNAMFLKHRVFPNSGTELSLYATTGTGCAHALMASLGCSMPRGLLIELN